MQLSKINKKLKDTGFELYKIDGVYYYYPISLDSPMMTVESCLHIVRISDIPSIEELKKDIYDRLNIKH